MKVVVRASGDCTILGDAVDYYNMYNGVSAGPEFEKLVSDVKDWLLDRFSVPAVKEVFDFLSSFAGKVAVPRFNVIWKDF